MAKITELLTLLAELQLDASQFAVFGSGPLAIRGLRETNDLDVIVTRKLWHELATQYTPADHEHGLKRIQIRDVEILDGWFPSVGDNEELIREADIIDGVRFVRLGKVIEWKRLRGEPRDFRDIQLIEDFLSRI